jgi:aldose 1-epimerase
MDPIIILAEGSTSVGLIPELGGSLAFARFGGSDILRPLSDEDRRRDDILGVACFPMVPYANRIADNAFEFRGQRYIFKPNLPGEPINEHGSGYNSRWAVTDQGKSTATMSLIYRDPENPYSYDTYQRVSVRGDGFSIAMKVTNRGKCAMPFGFGLHPWFHRDPDVLLGFDASQFWLLTRGPIPRERIAVPPELSHHDGKPLPRVYRENCYGGWEGQFEIRFPSRNLSVVVSAEPIFGHLMLYADPGMSVFCVEPQTNATGAFNQLNGPYDGLGEIVLDPDEAAEGTIDFHVSGL